MRESSKALCTPPHPWLQVCWKAAPSVFMGALAAKFDGGPGARVCVEPARWLVDPRTKGIGLT
eukprot:3076931-Pyramimonas_sp.AAC.1